MLNEDILQLTLKYVLLIVGTCQDITDQKAVQQEIEHSRRFLSAITDNMAEGMIATDNEGRVTFVNAAAERLLGWRAADLIGKSAHGSYHFRLPDGSPFARRSAPFAAFGNATRRFSSNMTHSSDAMAQHFPSPTVLLLCKPARSVVR